MLDPRFPKPTFETEVERLRAKAQRLTAAQSSAQLAESFRQTDALLEADLTTEDRMAVATARGFVMDELAERRELELVGACSDCFAELEDGSCPDSDCARARHCLDCGRMLTGARARLGVTCERHGGEVFHQAG